MKINPNPSRDMQDESAAALGDCGHEVYHGGFLAEWEGKMLCPDCWRTAVERELRENPTQVALEMQLSVEQYL